MAKGNETGQNCIWIEGTKNPERGFRIFKSMESNMLMTFGRFILRREPAPGVIGIL